MTPRKIMPSKSIVKDIACGELSITLNFADKEKKELKQIFINSEGGGCKANLALIQRLINRAIDNGYIDEALKSMDEVICGACKKRQREGKMVSDSCSAAISEAIKEVK